MKKLVAIALVLAMASAASAGIGFVAVGGPTYTPGQTVTINLVATGLCNGFSLATVSDFGAAGAVVGTPTFNAALTTSAGYVDNAPNIEGAVGILMDTWGAYAGGTAPAAGAVLFSFQYQIAATAPAGIITIAPVAGGVLVNDGVAPFNCNPSDADIAGQTQLIGGCTLNVIPEPMTLGLLGLGGLFLRRRVA